LDEGTIKSGTAETRAAAINSAVWLIDKALASSVLKVAGSGPKFEDRGRPWSQGAGGRVRIFAAQMSATAGLHIPAKTHKRRALTIPGAFWCELATLKPHLIFSYH
jgi:hypothetical protein